MPRDAEPTPKFAFPIEFTRGTIEIAVLSLLEQRPDHGYGVVQRLRAGTENTIALSEGAIYPLLRRMEQRGFLRATWVRSEHQRRARVYTITERGREWLDQRSRGWRTYAKALIQILERRSPLLEGGGDHAF